MGSTLQIYVFMRLVKTVVIFILGLTTIAFLIDFTELTNRTGGLPDYTIGKALMVTGLRVPFIIQVAVPFVMLFATITTLINLNKKYELVVARASGVSAWEFLRPTWAAALVIGIVCAGGLNPIAASSFSLAQSIEGQWKGLSGGGLFSSNTPWLRQTRAEGGSVLVGAQRVSSDGPTLFQPVFIETNVDAQFVRRIDAARARLGDGNWVLSDAEIMSPGETPQKRTRMQIPTDLDPAVIAEALLPPEMIAIYDLPRQIRTARSFGVPAAPFRMQMHALIALPALLVAMTLIAATVSLRFVRFGQSAGMILGGIGAGFVLYVVVEMTKSFGGAGILNPVIAAWFPVCAAGLFGVTYLLHREDG